jgi:hypothetical protein
MLPSPGFVLPDSYFLTFDLEIVVMSKLSVTLMFMLMCVEDGWVDKDK